VFPDPIILSVTVTNRWLNRVEKQVFIQIGCPSLPGCFNLRGAIAAVRQSTQEQPLIRGMQAKECPYGFPSGWVCLRLIKPRGL